MKKKDIQDLKDKPKLELERLLVEAKTQLRKAMFDLAAGKLQNVRAPKEIRKRIARLSTFLKNHGE